MPEPTYRIAKRLHERRAAVGLPKYGRHLDADSQGCMLVHALEEAADQVNYLLAEIQRRREAIQTLCNLIHGGTLPDHEADTVADIGYVIDLLGGEGVLKQYDEILCGGTVANSATVDPRDEALRVAEIGCAWARQRLMECLPDDAWSDSALGPIDAALAAIRAAGGAR